MSDLSVLSDAQLMGLLQLSPQPAPSAPPASPDAMTDEQLMQALGAPTSDRAGEGTLTPARDAGMAPQARAQAAPTAFGAGPRGRVGAGRLPTSRPAQVHPAKRLIPPPDARLARLRRLLLSGPAALPLVQTRSR